MITYLADHPNEPLQWLGQDARQSGDVVRRRGAEAKAVKEAEASARRAEEAAKEAERAARRSASGVGRGGCFYSACGGCVPSGHVNYSA